MSPGLRMTSLTRPGDGAASTRFDSRQRACSSVACACLTWFSAALIVSGRAGRPPTARLASRLADLRVGRLQRGRGACRSRPACRCRASTDRLAAPSTRSASAACGLGRLSASPSSTAISSGRLPILQVGKLRPAAWASAGLGLRDRDLGVGAFQRRPQACRRSTRSPRLHRDGLDLRPPRSAPAAR